MSKSNGDWNNQPGDVVRTSGIYRVVHHNGHREAHDIVLLAGQPFPFCAHCEQDAQFQLLRAAPHLEEDEDFREPQLDSAAAKHHRDEI